MKIGFLIALSASIVLIGAASCSKPATTPIELKYDNNSLKEYLPVSSPTFTGYLVSFVPPSNKFTITKIRVNGMVAAWGEYRDKSIELQIWDKDKNILYQVSWPDTQLPVNPYDSKTAFHPENAWTDIGVPGIVVSGPFYVHIHSEDGRWGEFRMGADDSVINSHSDLTVNDGNTDIILKDWPYWKKDASGNDLWYGDKTKVNWMIRVVGENSK